MTAILPPRCLQASLVSSSPSANWTLNDGTNDPYVGFPYQWNVVINIQPQAHANPSTPTPNGYTAQDIQVGDWLVQASSGFMLQILSISSATQTTINCVVEDVDRYNIFTDPNQGGSGIGSNSVNGAFDCFVMSLGSNGLPYYTNLSTGYLPVFVTDTINARFQTRNQNTDYIEVFQSGNTFAVNNPIILNSDGTFSLATAATSNVQKVVGLVSSTGTPGPGYFTYRPLGKLININLSSVGNLGDVIYIDVSGNLTNSAPANNAKPILIKISNTQGMEVFGGSAAGLTAVIQDTSPQLGGDLNVGTQQIYSTGSNNIVLNPRGTGTVQINGTGNGAIQAAFGNNLTLAGGGATGSAAPGNLILNGGLGFGTGTGGNVQINGGAGTPNGVVKINNLIYPSADGTSGQVLTTNGNGTLSFTTVSGGSGLASLTLTGDASGTNSGTNLAVTLASVNSNVGTFGSGSAIPVVTVNAKGLVTGVSTSALTLPTVGTAGVYGSATQVPVITTDVNGRVTSVSTANISNQTITVSGDASGSGSTAITLTLASVGTAGVYGSATQVPVITTDAKGRVTNVSTVSVSSGLASLTLTGDATGTNSGTNLAVTLASVGTAGTYGSATQIPVFVTDGKGRVISVTNTAFTLPSVGTAGTYGSATQVPVFVTDANGRVISVTNTSISSGLSSLTLTGDVTGTNSGTNLAATLASIGTAGTYGSASQVPVFVTDAKGRVTSVTNTPISIASTNVTGLGTMATENSSSVSITGGTINGTAIGGISPSTAAFTTLNTSGSTTFNGQAYTWPASQTASSVLTTNGSGTLTWTPTSSLAGSSGVTVTDGTTTVSATEVQFTSGATVTNAGSGIANVAINGLTKYYIQWGYNSTTPYSNGTTNNVAINSSGTSVLPAGWTAVYNSGNGTIVITPANIGTTTLLSWMIWGTSSAAGSTLINGLYPAGTYTARTASTSIAMTQTFSPYVITIGAANSPTTYASASGGNVFLELIFG